MRRKRALPGARAAEKGRAWARPFCDLHRPDQGNDGNHPLASGTATNRVASAVFTCSSTLCLPLELASLSADRTSPTLATALPPTLRITSPVLTPCSAAGPSGSTDVTTT